MHTTFEQSKLYKSCLFGPIVLSNLCKITVELGNPHSGSFGRIRPSAQRGLPFARERIRKCRADAWNKIGNGREGIGVKP